MIWRTPTADRDTAAPVVPTPTAGPYGSRSVRTAVASRLGRFVGWLSRTSRCGRGAVIGGRLTLALAPHALSQLTAGKTVVLVSGTNGKTTTSHLLAAMLRTGHPVASNDDGANMPGGLVAALLRSPRASAAVLEVDELYLPQVIDAVGPAAVVLLNLTRDQLDRVGEIRRLEAGIRAALHRQPSATVIGNADDPFVVSAAADLPGARWVGAGGRWSHDGTACPRCGRPIRRDCWSCHCGLSRPDPDWVLDGDALVGAGGEVVPLRLALPGRVNQANAALAVAAAGTLGVHPLTAVRAVRSVREVNGRYAVSRYGGRDVRLMLAKNPAGWSEMLDILDGSGTAELVLVINAREADGRDTSWLWDVPFEQLGGRTVTASGDRAEDVGTRLAYADVDYRVVSRLSDAIATAKPGPVDVVANYTAFLAARRALCDGR